MSKIHSGIPSCSASGKASTNGLQNATMTKASHGGGPYGCFATKKNIKHIIPVAASDRA